jgi:hypothetical protein
MRSQLRDSKQFETSLHWNDFVAALSLAALGVIVTYLVVGQ